MKNVTIMSVAAVAVALAGCRTVPVTERVQLMLSSEGTENAEGLSAYNQYKAQTPPTTNAAQQRLLEKVGNAIKDVAGETGFDWEFNVLQSSTVNAFCLPGGKVAVYTGIMPKFANEAEMACVVAHEIGHALARHGGERVSWNYMKAIGSLGIATLFGDTAESIYSVGADYGVILPFSRANESEADLIGLYLMAKAGYNPQAAVSFWQKFNTGNSSILDEITSTHPCDATRIQDLTNHMAEAQEFYRQSAVKRGLGVRLVNGVPVDDEAVPSAPQGSAVDEIIL